MCIYLRNISSEQADKNLEPSKDPNRYITETIPMASKHMKRCSPLLDIKGIQIKFTMSHPKHSLQCLREEEREKIWIHEK